MLQHLIQCNELENELDHHSCHNCHYGQLWPLWHLWPMAYGKTNVTIISIQWKSIEKLTHLCCLKSYSCLNFSSWSLYWGPHCKNGLGAKKLSTWFPMLKSWKPKHVFFRQWSKKKKSNRGHLILLFLFHSVSIYSACCSTRCSDCWTVYVHNSWSEISPGSRSEFSTHDGH